MKLSLSKLYLHLENNNFDINKFIIDTNEPDFHLSIMRTCKNLLIHKGGYSLLGGLLFNGNNLYITNIFNPLETHNEEYFTYIKNYVLL